MSFAVPVLALGASGPVIPHFGGASDCVVESHQFCAGWFTQNFNTVFGPRLVEHIELTAIQSGFKTEFIAAGGLAIALAIVADILLILLQGTITPWSRGRLRA